MSFQSNSVTETLLEQSAPGLDDVVAHAMRRVSLNLRVCMPAKVVQVLGPQFVDLKPLFQQRIGTALTDYPIISGALVCMPIGGDFRISYSLKPGDTGVMLCADRSLDAYAASNGISPVDPADARAHQLTDAIFVPGLLPHARQTETTDDMVLGNGLARMRLQKEGTFTLSNGTQELVALISNLAAQVKALGQALSQAKSTTPGGPLDPGTLAAATASALAAGQIQAGIESLKGS